MNTATYRQYTGASQIMKADIVIEGIENGRPFSLSMPRWWAEQHRTRAINSGWMCGAMPPSTPA